MKLIKAAIGMECKLDEIIHKHQFLKTAISIEENACKCKQAILKKAVQGLLLLRKLKIK